MSKKKNGKKRRKWKSGLQAGCLALGLTTAWGTDACGDVILHVSATPTRTLTNAFVYFSANNSFLALESLGILSTGQMTELSRTVPGELEDYTNYGYHVVGLYNEGDSTGVARSFSNDDVLITHQQWADLFESSPVSHYNHTETEFIDALNLASTGNIDPLWNCLYYNAGPGGAFYGIESTLVNFSDPTFGGVVTVDILPVPEPAAWVLVIGLSGAVLLWRRDLLGG